MSFSEKPKSSDVARGPDEVDEAVGTVLDPADVDGEVNASGHPDQLTRQYGLLRVAGAAITIDNAWVVLGSSISVSIANGGIPGILYGLMVAAFYYAFIGLSLAELASAMPSSGGVYHWATMVAGPRLGRPVGFFTGWLNFAAWLFGLASLVQVAANTVVQLYATYHPAFASQAWHVYVAYLGVLWLSTACVVLANGLVPHTQSAGMVLVLAGGLATIVTLAAMPRQRASDHFVWASFAENNATGWPGGVAFLTGVLNGAFTIGTPDSISHMAEEVRDPRRNVPRGILLQIGLGFLSAFCFAIVLGYAISDIAVLQGGVNTFPLAAIYAQATHSAGATFGLLLIIFLSLLCGVTGTVLTATRAYWALARDHAVPFARVFARVHARLSCPVEATLFVSLVVSALGAIPLGSAVGFTNLTGSFIVLNTISYAVPFSTNLLARRRYFTPGPFHLGRFGFAVNLLAVLFIALFAVFFCFPPATPFDATTMNYNCVIIVGIVVLVAAWWFLHAAKHYELPHLKMAVDHNT
ncbi:choline transport protein [Sporothrix schenckii 1099-18]|uniref:Choline transport protein n=1 Tax=Sporothrix schenckii 1099-18 TaxID=1397361 RepID=A0A0F2MCR6_SPOSC|nr:choline transport protein [Sporothrix schenckii 1099-18]KJR87473.1 choline transport protein [Sporothrix schenckii 1099-18]